MHQIEKDYTKWQENTKQKNYILNSKIIHKTAKAYIKQHNNTLNSKKLHKIAKKYIKQ